MAMVYSSIFINTNSADSKKISFFNDNEDFDSFAFNDVEGEFLIETFYNYNYLLATDINLILKICLSAMMISMVMSCHH